MNEENCFVKVIYTTDEISISPMSYPHVKYCSPANTGRYLIGGGFYSGKRGSLLFEAKNKEEAEKIATSILNKKYGKYKIIKSYVIN